MAGYYETQVRRALLTVGDADVLNEMATGWRTSIRDLNTVDDRLSRAIRGLADREQLGDQTREAAVAAFREMRDYVADQRRMLARTAQALDAAGGALGQVKALVRTWDRAGDPVPPGRAPVADPAQTDQTEFWRLSAIHRRQSATFATEVQQREDDARDAWQSLNRIFGMAEDKIRDAHGIEREDPTVEPPTVWPPPEWPGRPPEPPVPGWPPLPPWPPVTERPPRFPETGLPPNGLPPDGLPPDGRPPTGPGTGLPPGAVPHPEATGPGPQPGSGAHPGHGAGPSTTVGGSSQSGVSYAPGNAAASFAAPAGAGAGTAAPMAMSSMGGAAAAAAAGAAAGAAGRGGAAAAGAAGRAGGAARGAAASGKGAAAGAGSRSGGRAGRAAPGGKGSQQASRQARSERVSGAAGGRGGRRKDKADVRRDDLLDTDDHWLDDEGTAPDVLR